MLISMQASARQEAVDEVLRRVESQGLRAARVMRNGCVSIVAPLGHGDFQSLRGAVEQLPGVERVTPIPLPYKLVSRMAHPEGSVVCIAPGADFGGRSFVMMAGPCTVESESQLLRAAHAVRKAGATVLRGGAFKPRTSPYYFQGLGEEGLRLLGKAKRETGLAVITEVMTPEHVEAVAEVADILQVGTRNMQNYFLLRKLGQTRKAVLLKRGMSATIDEWLLAAEYIVAEGNPNVILCERGIRSFDPHTRNTLDLGGVAMARELTHLPIVVDPSQATGRRSLVPPLCRAAVAAGADGLLVEVHPEPEEALVDGAQSLSLDEFGNLMRSLQTYLWAEGRVLAIGSPGKETTMRRSV